EGGICGGGGGGGGVGGGSERGCGSDGNRFGASGRSDAGRTLVGSNPARFSAADRLLVPRRGKAAHRRRRRGKVRREASMRLLRIYWALLAFGCSSARTIPSDSPPPAASPPATTAPKPPEPPNLRIGESGRPRCYDITLTID